MIFLCGHSISDVQMTKCVNLGRCKTPSNWHQIWMPNVVGRINIARYQEESHESLIWNLKMMLSHESLIWNLQMMLSHESLIWNLQMMFKAKKHHANKSNMLQFLLSFRNESWSCKYAPNPSSLYMLVVYYVDWFLSVKILGAP